MVKTMVPRKPTALKLVEGAYIKNPQLRPTNEPEPTGMPEQPEWLGPIAAEEWGRITREMEHLGVLSQVERSAIEAYCRTYEEFRANCDDVAENGRWAINANGDQIERKATAGVLKCADQLLKFLVQFGMTPAARGRVSVEKKPKGESIQERFFGAG